jgi:predicted MFS family arabinose efflux permease
MGGSGGNAGLAPLRERGYRLLWTSALIWYFARWLNILVSGWLALELTNSAWLVALIGFFRTAPVPIFGAFAGAIADRFDRRRLVVFAEGLNVLATALIAYLLLAGRLEYWHLAGANLIYGLAWAIEFPARRAMTPDLAGRDLVVPAIVLDTMSMNVSKALGPLVGGGLIASLGTTTSYVLLTCLYAATILPLIPLRLPPVANARPTVSSIRFLGEGLDFCRRHPAVRGVLLITVVMNVLGFPYIQLLPVFARDILLVGPFGLGLLTAADGIGSLVGTAALTGAGRIRRVGLLFVVGSVTMTTCLVLFAVSPLYALALGLLILAGFAHSGFSTFQSTIILGAAGDALRGRAMGVLTLAIGSAPVGMLLLGVLAAAFGAPLAVAASAATGAALIGLTAWRTPGLVGHRATESAEPASGNPVVAQPTPSRT